MATSLFSLTPLPLPMASWVSTFRLLTLSLVRLASTTTYSSRNSHQKIHRALLQARRLPQLLFGTLQLLSLLGVQSLLPSSRAQMLATYITLFLLSIVLASLNLLSIAPLLLLSLLVAQ